MLKTLGEKIRALRDAAGLTQEMLAKKVGVSKNTVLNWEKKWYFVNFLPFACGRFFSLSPCCGTKKEGAR
jgi:hypothetical protein